MALLLECLPPGEEGPPALRDADEDVAVEVDGDHHFFVNDQRRPTGTTLFKRALLDAAMKKGLMDDWIYVAVWEWLDKTKQQRIKLLQAKLDEKGIRV